MLTIRQALELPILRQARVVAGASGLEHQIHWLHIVDIPDAHYEWHRQGVLLLTAGFGLHGSEERQAALVPKLVVEGFAGMIFCVGYYFEEIPQAMVADADRLGFPLIETPRSLLFIDISEAILEQIINRQYALLQQSEQINSRLTDLVLKGANLDDLATTLARILRRSITFEDASFRVLATAQFGEVDEARQRSVQRGQTAPEVARHLLDEGIYARLLEHMAPVHVRPMPELGMEMERFVAPVIVDREIYGYIWIISGDRPLTELDELAIRHGATVAALILFKEEAVQKVEEKQRGDFLERLLNGEDGSVSFSEQSERLGFRLNAAHQVLLIHSPSGASGITRSLMVHVSRWLEEKELEALLVWRDEYLVLVLETDTSSTGKEVASALTGEVSHPVQQLLAGVGTSLPSANGVSGGVQQSYEEARESVRVGLALGQEEGVVAFEDLGLLHWLYHLPAESWAKNVYLRHVERLVDYDERRGTKLLRSLESYLEQGGSVVEAAQSLFIHRNTLLHRLERISELCDIDIRDPWHRLNLYAAVKGYRLRKHRH